MSAAIGCTHELLRILHSFATPLTFKHLQWTVERVELTADPFRGLQVWHLKRAFLAPHAFARSLRALFLFHFQAYFLTGKFL